MTSLQPAPPSSVPENFWTYFKYTLGIDLKLCHRVATFKLSGVKAYSHKSWVIISALFQNALKSLWLGVPKDCGQCDTLERCWGKNKSLNLFKGSNRDWRGSANFVRHLKKRGASMEQFRCNMQHLNLLFKISLSGIANRVRFKASQTLFISGNWKEGDEIKDRWNYQAVAIAYYGSPNSKNSPKRLKSTEFCLHPFWEWTLLVICIG